MHNTNTKITFKCPLSIFYEMHSSPVVGNTLLKLLPTFKAYGYKHFAIELPRNETLTDNIEFLNSQANEFKKMRFVLKNPMLPDDIRMQLMSYIATPPQNKKDKTKYVNEVIEFLDSRYKATISKIELLKALEKQDNIKYSSIGNEDGINDDTNLIQNIIELYEQDQAPIIAYLGIGHIAVGTFLKTYNIIQEYYIVDYPPTSTHEAVNYYDGIVRTTDLSHSINIIDLYNQPEQNPIQLVKDSLVNFNQPEF